MLSTFIGEIGDLETIKTGENEAPTTMGSEDILIEHTALGFNYEDCALAMGLYPYQYYQPRMKEVNQILGLEAAGVIKKVGTKVDRFKTGDRVIYCIGTVGSYCKQRVIHHTFAQKIPDFISDNVAAAVCRKGLMAHSLLYKTIAVKKESFVMIHNVTDPLESILSTWASAVGLKVIGTIGKEQHREEAKELGCQLIINRNRDSTIDLVREFTKGEGVRVVYDSIGKGVEDISIACMRPFGNYMHYHSKNGYPNIPVEKMLEKSLFAAFPTIEIQKGGQIEMLAGLEALFQIIKEGKLKPKFEKASLNASKKAIQSTLDQSFRKNIIFDVN